ncbi:MAG TPA: PIN domain-containing protein [Terracidiphilus sp.]|nr:PIN domain-containing protein [Terracidiphilus sp.]
MLLDTSVIVAWLNRRDHHHERCVAALSGLRQPMATCEAVIAESCYMVQSIPAAIDKVLANVADGIFQIPFRLSECAAAVGSLLGKYRDTPADFADACLINMANELGTGDILTLDSDFRHYRWRRNRSFRLLIPLD